MDAPYRIRSAVAADAAGLYAIERRAFSDPWSEASFREALVSPWSFGLVAESGTVNVAESRRPVVVRELRPARPHFAAAEELERHRAFIARLVNPLWERFAGAN